MRAATIGSFAAVVLFSASAWAAPSITSIPLPGATDAGVGMDYIAYDRLNHRVWVPAGNTGNVDVVEVATGKVTPVTGFPTSEMERNGHKRTVGPSSASVGEGQVFIGSRADSNVCEVDAKSLQKGPCLKLDSSPDALVWVGSSKELWVTTPRDHSILILDASKPAALTLKGKISLEGQPEGFALDEGRGVFFTNYEDKDKTLVIDLKTRKIAKTWLPACGEDGPKGISVDHALNLLMVACTDKVKVMDIAHDGKILSSVDTGEGIDNIDYLESKHQLFAAAARVGKMTVATLDAKGKLTVAAVVPTGAGARNAVITEEGAAYLTDSPEGKLVVVAPLP